MTLDKAIEENPALKELQSQDERVAGLLAAAKRLEGMTRHASVHAAGVVIAPRPIVEFAPLYKSQKDEITTQWAMKEIERVGLLKMDFLGLSTLTLLFDAVGHIRATTGRDLQLDQIPLDDAKTYQLFCEGHTNGIFQFESSGMKDTLRKAKPQCLEDLIALNALYRPGPLRGGVVDDYIARKHGRVDIKYEVPQLEPILKETYGVIAYQEQVMRIASDLAGFTMGEADLLRKAMGKKNAAVMQAQRQRFMQGAQARGIAQKKAAKIFDLMEFFAGYGFNKSHSTTYAYLAYQTAYLKANYPWHFMAALLTIEAQNTEKLAMYLGECRDLGVPILGPDINESELAFTVVSEGVRYGLMAVKNVGEGAIQSIISVRREHGRIDSLFTMCEHIDLRLVNKRVLESLVKAGAFDSVAPAGMPAPLARARLFAAVDRALEHGNRQQKDRDKGQHDLFGSGMTGEGDAAPHAIPLPDVPAWTEAQELAFEKEALGFYMSGHPLERHADDLRAFGARTIGDLASSEADVWVGGIVSGLRPLKTRKGDRMCVFMLEEPAGSLETVVFPETFSKHGHFAENDAMLIVRGKFERDDESARLVATEILPIAALKERVTREVAIRLRMPPCDRHTLEALAELLAKHRGDRRVSIELDMTTAGGPMRVRTDAGPVRVRPSERLVAEVERLCGSGSISLR
jgi:DNA polymerase-3 subunit alpha